MKRVDRERGGMKEAKKWLEKAERDLSAAEINHRQGLFEVAAFLSHQAAEKALKALYILKFRKLWKIHDFEKLSITLKSGKRIITVCKELNPHYLATRYPIEVEYDEGKAKHALENGRKVVEWVKKKVKL